MKLSVERIAHHSYHSSIILTVTQVDTGTTRRQNYRCSCRQTKEIVNIILRLIPIEGCCWRVCCYSSAAAAEAAAAVGEVVRMATIPVVMVVMTLVDPLWYP